MTTLTPKSKTEKTILSPYPVKALAKILKITAEEAKTLKTDPAARLSLAQFQSLTPTLPNPLIPAKQAKIQRQSNRPFSKLPLPAKKDMYQLWFHIKSDPVGPENLREVNVVFRRKTIRTTLPIQNPNPDSILAALFTQYEMAEQPMLKYARPFKQRLQPDLQPFANPIIMRDTFAEEILDLQKQEALETRAKIDKLFGPTLTKLFHNLALREPKTILELYESQPRVRLPIPKPEYEHNLLFPQAEKLYRTTDPRTEQLFSQLDRNYIKKTTGRESVYYTGKELTILGMSVTDNTQDPVYIYPTDNTNQHILWSTPYIDLLETNVTQEDITTARRDNNKNLLLSMISYTRIYLTKNTKPILVPTQPKAIILLGNNKYILSQAPLDTIRQTLDTPTTRTQPHPKIRKELEVQ